MAKTLAQLGLEHEGLRRIKEALIDDEILEQKMAVTISQADYLNNTQPMRVVALNEACGIAKAMLEKGYNPEITKMAQEFARFLIDGKY